MVTTDFGKTHDGNGASAACPIVTCLVRAEGARLCPWASEDGRKTSGLVARHGAERTITTKSIFVVAVDPDKVFGPRGQRKRSSQKVRAPQPHHGPSRQRRRHNRENGTEVQWDKHAGALPEGTGGYRIWRKGNNFRGTRHQEGAYSTTRKRVDQWAAFEGAQSSAVATVPGPTGVLAGA